MGQAFGPSPSVPPPAAAYYAAAGPRTPYGPKDRGPLVLRAGPGAKGDGGPPLRAQGPGALGPPGRGWYRRPGLRLHTYAAAGPRALGLDETRCTILPTTPTIAAHKDSLDPYCTRPRRRILYYTILYYTILY